MPSYAIVMTGDEKFLPGINGMLNAMKYYSMEHIEVHLVHNFPESSDYIERANEVFGSFFRPVRITDYYNQCRREYWSQQTRHSKSSMKYARWWYPVDCLGECDALCVLDADRLIVSDLTRWFDMIARSDMIGLAANDWSEAMWDSYDDARAMAANPPLYSNPYFVSGRRAQEIFPLIPEYAENPNKYYPPYKGRSNTTGDMHPVNLTILQTGMLKDLYPLPATQWVLVEYNHVRLCEREINGRRHLAIHKNGDILHTVHRRYWGQRDCARYMNGRTRERFDNAVNNVQLFWNWYKYFNTELYLRLDWKWGEFPAIPENPYK